MTGRVIAWNSYKGFGFVRPDEGVRDVFVHALELVDAPALRRGQAVRFTLVDRGRGPRAIDVRVLEPAALADSRR
jgi:CspA family cold shock protein